MNKNDRADVMQKLEKFKDDPSWKSFENQSCLFELVFRWPEASRILLKEGFSGAEIQYIFSYFSRKLNHS